ncbi:MAG TPA: hypothetical protein VLS90_18290 [Thermodesulfobacteriota bacterium]|nr:hypothetical protein [Thermodesulfobacteriota bacterium]
MGKLKKEINALVLATVYFGSWIGVFMILKKLILAEYRIEFHGLSLAVVGTLVLAKVVLVLEHVPLGSWTRSRPAWVHVVLRTALYAVGVLVVLVLEKAFETRHEHGGFGPSILAVFHHPEAPHVWANTICLTGALLGYNILSCVRRRLGEGGLARLFLAPLPENRGS